MKKDPVLVQFGERLRKERVKRGLSQEKLSELAGLNRNSIGNIERAEKNVTLKSQHQRNILSIALQPSILNSRYFPPDNDHTLILLIL